VIPQTIIKEQGARTLTEVLRNTPGISFNAGENGFATSTNNFSMRGFDSSGSIFFDGARDSGSYTRDVFNVERVEVFKGAAADNGRGTAGGYVNLVTKTPQLRNFFGGEFSYGVDAYNADSRKRATVDSNYKFLDHAALRLNLLYEDGGMAGREVAKKGTIGFAPSVAVGLGTSTRAIVAYEYVRQRDRPDWGVPGATIDGLVTFSGAAANAPRDAFYGLRSDFDNTTSHVLLARFEHDVAANWTISNQTRWSLVSRDARYTIPTGFVAATQQVTTQTQFYDRVTSSLSNLTNMTGKFEIAGMRHTLSTGLELSRERSWAQRYGTVNPGNTGLFNPNPDRAGGSNLAPTERNEVRVDTLALYAYDTVKVAPAFEVTGGLRLEWYRVGIDSRTLAGAPSGSVTGFEETKFQVGGKIGAIYKPAENGSVYAAFSVAGQPPGSYLSNPDISRTGDNAFPGFVAGAKGITSYNYEIGTKWDFFGGRLSTTAAFFRTDKTGVPITGRDVGETVDTLKGYGRQTVHGLEVSASGSITPEWKVFGGLLLMDSRRHHSQYLDDVRRRANPADYGAITSTDGDQLAFTPRFTGNLWTTYRFPIGVTFGGGIQHVSSSYLGRPDDASRIIPNGMVGRLPSYTLFHLMAAWEITEQVTLRFNVHNVFDNKHAVSTNWNGSRATLGMPRTFTLSTALNF